MQNDLLELWKEWWTGDIWIAPWSRALDGLSVEQASWTPDSARHSIWQLVNHLIFWRGVTLERIAGAPPSDREPTHDEQFAQPRGVTEAAWEDARQRLRDSHERMLRAISDDAIPKDRLRYHLAHDAYHLGQIMQLRALQGLPPVL